MAQAIASFTGMRATASFVGAKAEKSLKSFVPSATSGPKQVRSPSLQPTRRASLSRGSVVRNHPLHRRIHCPERAWRMLTHRLRTVERIIP